MAEFVLDTNGTVPLHGRRAHLNPAEFTAWDDLDSFTQGYIEALFFTSEAPGVTTEEWQATEDHPEGSIPGDVGFSDLAPETLAAVIADCAAFQKKKVLALACCQMTEEEREELAEHGHGPGWDSESETARDLGRDFWFTRNGHGVGFWDKDWPEPWATTLADAAQSFGEVDAYLGDDGKVYLS
jgi:hypothetical protein